MYYATPHDEQLLPDILIKMAPFSSYTHQQFETLKLPNNRMVNVKASQAYPPKYYAEWQAWNLRMPARPGAKVAPAVD